MEYSEEQIKKLIKRQKAYAKVSEAEELIEKALDLITETSRILDGNSAAYRLSAELEGKLEKQHKRCFKLSQVVFDGR